MKNPSASFMHLNWFVRLRRIFISLESNINVWLCFYHLVAIVFSFKTSFKHFRFVYSFFPSYNAELEVTRLKHRACHLNRSEFMFFLCNVWNVFQHFEMLYNSTFSDGQEYSVRVMALSFWFQCFNDTLLTSRVLQFNEMKIQFVDASWRFFPSSYERLDIPFDYVPDAPCIRIYTNVE